MLLTLPSNLVAGALSRARALWPRGQAAELWPCWSDSSASWSRSSRPEACWPSPSPLSPRRCSTAVYLLTIDAPRLFPFLRGARATHSWRWVVGQFRKAAPFAVAGATELALLNLPVLLVSALVSDRVAVAQWGLTRVVAGLLRRSASRPRFRWPPNSATIMPSARRSGCASLYARGSVFVTLLASVVVSGLLPFWQDFFALWTHGAVPYDPVLDDHAADRHRPRSRRRSWRWATPITAIAAICWCGPRDCSCGIPGPVGDPDPADRTARCGHCGRRQRSADSVRAARVGSSSGRRCSTRFGMSPFLAAMMIAVTLAGWALGTAIRLVDARGPGPLRFCRRMRAVAGGCRWSPPARLRSKASATRLIAAIPR